MIVSLKNRFLFVHNPKTAGTSLETALQEHSHACNRSAAVKARFFLARFGINEDWRYRHYPKHFKASDIHPLVPAQTWASLFKFGFVRNPFDRHVSLYLYTRRTETTRSHSIVSKIDSFHEYVRALYNEPAFQSNRLVFQKSYFVGDDGNQIVDFIGRFEDLKNDVKQVAEKTGVDIKLPWALKSNRKHYRDYYNDETRRLVEEYSKPDLEEYGYDF